MNLKDRLENIKKTDVISVKEFSSAVDFSGITDIFDVEDNVKNIIIDLIKKRKNIILIGDKSVDKTLISNYIQSISGTENYVVVNKTDDIPLNPDSDMYIFPKPSVKETVKIFEYILYGYKSFIFGLDFDASNNIIEKLKVVIAVNFENMTDKDIDILLSESDAVFIFISKNEDGLYRVSQIKEQEYIRESFNLNVLYDFEEEQKNINENLISENQQEVIAENTENEIQPAALPENAEIEENTQEYETANIQSPEENISVEIVDIPAETEKPEEIENIASEEENTKEDNAASENSEEVPIKINKYKLLKEKIKNKRNNL